MRILIIFISLSLLSACVPLPPEKRAVKKDSLLYLEIKGMITSETSEKFMTAIRDYAGHKSIKGVLIRMNSPGGTVGASQEINQTIKDIQDYYKKPVIVSAGDLMASGGVFSAVSANKIFLNKGTLFGSIGVIMQFSNLTELAKWAKVDVYSLKAGEFKDSGTPFRRMTLRERELFENTLDNVLEQFKSAIVEGRKLSEDDIDKIADGRIITGEEAVAYGLVDGIGSLNMAIKEAGKMSGLGSRPELFNPHQKGLLDEYFGKIGTKTFLDKIMSKVMTLSQISGQPLYILPSYLFPQ